jgi:hypothetical protein
MRLTAALGGLLVAAAALRSQTNLVANPSFEVLSACPPTAGSLASAPPWYSPPGSDGTPDLFHPCATSPYVQAPGNAWGTQQARTGEAYAGIYAMQWPFFVMVIREYLRVPLTQPLEAGVEYCVRYHASLSELSAYSVHSLGVFFSASEDQTYDEYLMLATPQVVNTPLAYLTDTAGWMPLGGTYVATGGEQYLTIGNFLAYDNGTALQEMPGQQLLDHAYYYIDDVSLTPASEVEGPCELHTGVRTLPAADVQVAPNPVSSVAVITVPHATAGFHLTVFDAQGRAVRHTHVAGTTGTFSREGLGSGAYFLRVAEPEGRVLDQRMLVVE